ncbi:MAG: nuclear transport factor 2 family protein [Janthinobacterium lividum]
MQNENHHHVWEAWHQASLDRDQEALLSLYAEDATLEAPLILSVLQQETGIVYGRDRIRNFLEQARRSGAASSSPSVPMHWWRENHYFSAGDTLIWEYPRETPKGDQMDVVEVMTIKNGLIAHHKVYWGWKLTARLVEA